MVDFSIADSIIQAEYSDFFNSCFGRPYFINGIVNNDGVKVHQNSSFYAVPGINAQGFIDFSDVYIGFEPDTALMRSKSIHERGHAIGLYHDNSRNGFMNDAGIYLPDSLDKKIVNTGYDYMNAFKNGQTDFYLAQLSDTTIINGVAGNPIDQLVPLKQRILQKIYPSPAKTPVTIEYQLINPTHMHIEIYNIQGQKIKTILDGNEYPGAHEKVWNLKNEQGEKVSSGLYLIRFDIQQHPEYSKTGKILIVK